MKLTDEYKKSFVEGVRLKMNGKERKRKARQKAMRITVACVLAVALTVCFFSFGGFGKNKTPTDTDSTDTAASEIIDASESKEDIVIEASIADTSVSDTSKPTNLELQYVSFRYGSDSLFGEYFWQNNIASVFDDMKLLLSNGEIVYLDGFSQLSGYEFYLDIDPNDEEKEYYVTYEVQIHHTHALNTRYNEVMPWNKTYQPWLDMVAERYGVRDPDAESHYNDKRTYEPEVYYYRRLFDIEQYCLKYWNDGEHEEAYNALVKDGISEEWVLKYGIKAWQRNLGYGQCMTELDCPECQNPNISVDYTVPEYHFIEEQNETLRRIGREDYVLEGYYNLNDYAKHVHGVDYNSVQYKNMEYWEFSTNVLSDYQGHYNAYLKGLEKTLGKSLDTFMLERKKVLLEYYVEEYKEALEQVGIDYESVDRILMENNESVRVIVTGYFTKAELQGLKTLPCGSYVTIEYADEAEREEFSNSHTWIGDWLVPVDEMDQYREKLSMLQKENAEKNNTDSSDLDIPVNADISDVNYSVITYENTDS